MKETVQRKIFEWLKSIVIVTGIVTLFMTSLGSYIGFPQAMVCVAAGTLRFFLMGSQEED